MERIVQPPVRSCVISFSQRHRHRHPSYGRWSALVVACNLTAVNDEPPLRVMFAAGGTGGHVFPAIAIADALKDVHPLSIIQFAGTKHRIEASVVPLAGYPFHPIPAAVALRRPIFSPVNVLLPFKLIISLCVCLYLIAKFRPHLVVGTGGYVSGPLCIAAALFRCPFIIQEQNAYPGITNRVLSRFSVIVFVAFAAAIPYFPIRKCVLSGNPVRSSLQHSVPKSEAFRHFFPDYKSDRKNYHCDNNDGDGEGLVLKDPSTHKLIVPQVVLVVGGSSGAQSINEAVSGMVIQMLNQHPERFVIWQTGPKHYKNVTNTIGNHQRLLISEFLNDMNLAYSAADIVVTRSGAITCSELLISGKPSILIPSRYVTDDHQTKNANALVDAGAARVLSDLNLDSSKLEQEINGLLGDRASMLRMRKGALKVAVSDAANLIAREIVSLAKCSAS